jgi:hypothetical protein
MGGGGVQGHHCIHILFVLLKVLKVSSSDPILYQRALLTSEVPSPQPVVSRTPPPHGAHSWGGVQLEGIYKSAPLAPAQAYARRKTSSSSSSSSSSSAAPADQDLRSQWYRALLCLRSHYSYYQA